MRRKKGIFALALVAVIILTGCGESDGQALEEIQKGNQRIGVSVHDPSIVKAEGRYYIFGSHMEAAESTDLKSWKSFASGVNAGNPLFDNLFSEDMKAFEYVGKYTDGGYAVWAPDVIYNKAMNKWVMYFSTSHDYRTSNICFATADEVTGPYTYQDTILYSGFTSMTAKKTNFFEIMGKDAKVRDYLTAGQYNNLKYPNCIDPTLFYDEEDRLWMVYGSWSGGIWLLEIDDTTGYPIHPETNEDTHTDKYFGKYLIGGLHNSCEGPYILFDDESGFYYLFVSYGELTEKEDIRSDNFVLRRRKDLIWM
jgi:arabinan endo-1,5-alpha-L-arabinosidase